MEERKLNFNARLLSVRRFATTSVSKDGESGKIIEKSSPSTAQHALSPHESYFNMDQVTEPAALVPFHWEQIPGKAKDGNEAEPRPLEEEPSVTPRLPPGKVLSAMKQSSGMDYAYQNGSRPQMKAYSFNDKVMESKCSKEGLNQRGGLGLEDDNDVYSDALETLSSTESVSLNCSASGLSGYDGTDVKQTGTFSKDSQTRDFMMRRFLPAAKAMVLDSPHYATRRQPMALEQPREIKKMVNEDKTFVHNERDSEAVPQIGQYQEEEESEDEVEEYDESPSISAKGCGLFPRLRLRNSLCLLNPLPGMKVRTRAHTAPTPEVARPGRKANNQSEYKTVNKHAHDVAYKQKSDRGFRSGELQVVKSKGAGESRRFAYSGELQKGRSSPFRQPRSGGVSPFQNAPCQSPFRGQSDCGIRSGELQVVKSRLVSESSRFAYSGELPKGRISPFRQPRSGGISPFRNEAHESPFRGESDRGVLSAELQAVKSKLAGESSRFTFSGDLQKGRTSPFRQSRSGGISPYRNEARQSPFREVGLLGIPKEGNIKTSSRTNLYSRSSNKFQDALTHQKNKPGSFSMVPAIEKTVYVDTVNNNIAERSCPKSGSIGTKGQLNSAGEEFENFLEQMGIEETSTAESLFRDVKCPSIVERESILEPQVFDSVDDKQSSLSEISHFKDQAVMEASGLGLGQEIKSLDLPKLLTAKETADINTGQIVKADVEDVNASFVPSPLPPPLPRSPSESWLWRTLPSVSLKNPISRMNLGLLTKKLESKTSSTNTKWETIVKTSNLNHDHARYSEELISHISQQSKT